MPITVIVRSTDNDLPTDKLPRLTFDGHRIVLGRGRSCDVRLPDPSVTMRHASIRARHGEYELLDEGSTNGTFLGNERLQPHTAYRLRSGDLIRLGRVWLEVRIEQVPPTGDLAVATRDLAIAMVSQALRALGSGVELRIKVAKGRDVGKSLVLAREGIVYRCGRNEACELVLTDPDVSREHVQFVRQGNSVRAQDLGSKNGLLLADTRVPSGHEFVWRPGVALQVGYTVLLLDEPVLEALALLEGSPDEPLAREYTPIPPKREEAEPKKESTDAEIGPSEPPGADEEKSLLPSDRTPSSKPGQTSGWTRADIAILLWALLTFALSLAGLYWLLRT